LHCINGLQLAAKSKSPFYAAHAGFCIDPDPNELGNKIRLKNDFDIKTHINIFIESILSLLIFARKFKVKFLIENNVITSQNLLHNSNPLLCCDSDQIISIFNEINDDNFGLLLDTAHLKVSAKTLENDLDCEYNKIKKYVKGLHHSDNDGFIDNNCKLSSNYWFLKYCKNHNDIPNVIEVKNLTIIEIKDHIKLLNNA
jgi:sugar phosphate isomerase/epimerase